MNIHEHQAKDLLREFGAPVPRGVVVYNIGELIQKIETLSTNSLVINPGIDACISPAFSSSEDANPNSVNNKSSSVCIVIIAS